MGRRLNPFIVLLTAVAVTRSQPTITQTDADLDDQCDTSEDKLSVFSAEIETMKENIQTIAGRMSEVRYGMCKHNMVSRLVR